jgi:hypothetical protein
VREHYFTFTLHHTSDWLHDMVASDWYTMQLSGVERHAKGDRTFSLHWECNDLLIVKVHLVVE